MRCVYVATYSCNVQNLVLKASKRKMRDTAEACRSQGLTFLPVAMETLGGLHSTAVGQVKKLGAALARKKGCGERESTIKNPAVQMRKHFSCKSTNGDMFLQSYYLIFLDQTHILQNPCGTCCCACPRPNLMWGLWCMCDVCITKEHLHSSIICSIVSDGS